MSSSADVRRFYWDACAWLGFINEEPDKITPLRAIWADAQKGQIQIWTSVYSYLEVIGAPLPHGKAYPSIEDDEKVFGLMEQPHVRRIQVDVEVAKLARKLKRDHHPQLKKRPDAIHLASALYYDCEELHTWDSSDLLPLDNKINCWSGKPLRIVVPGMEVFGEIFRGLGKDDKASEA